MESFLQALGMAGIVLLVVIGLLAGWIASAVMGGADRGRYLVVGVLAALATPFVLAAIGLGVLAAYGLAAILFVAAIGAIVVIAIVKLISG